MESQSTPGFNFDRTQGVASGGYTFRSSSTPTQLAEKILRAVAVVLTFISAIVMGVAKDSVTVVITDPSTSVVRTVPGSLKSKDSAAFVYFIVANVLVLLYSVASLAITVANRTGSRKMELPVSIADLVVVVLLFSSNGAAIAVDIVAEHGQARLGWTRVCGAAHKFCANATAAIVLSMFASVAYLVLLKLEIINLHRRSL